MKQPKNGYNEQRVEEEYKLRKMDTQPDKYISNIDRPGTFSAILHSVLGIVRWLIGFFTLTKEERLAAGIYFGSEERDG